MALADVRTLTYGSRNKILHRKHSTLIIEMAETSQMLPGPAAGEVAAGLSSPRGSAASEHTAAEGHTHISARAATLVAERMERLRPPHRDARLHSTHHYTLAGSLNATKRRPCLWITKRCLWWNAKT